MLHWSDNWSVGVLYHSMQSSYMPINVHDNVPLCFAIYVTWRFSPSLDYSNCKSFRLQWASCTLLHCNCDTSMYSLHCPCGSLIVQSLLPEPARLPCGCQWQQWAGHSDHPAANGCVCYWVVGHKYIRTQAAVAPKLGDQLPHNVSKPIPCCSKDTCPATLGKSRTMDDWLTSQAIATCI